MPFGVLLGWDWLMSRQEYVGKHCRRVDVLHMPVGVLQVMVKWCPCKKVLVDVTGGWVFQTCLLAY